MAGAVTKGKREIKARKGKPTRESGTSSNVVQVDTSGESQRKAPRPVEPMFDMSAAAEADMIKCQISAEETAMENLSSLRGQELKVHEERERLLDDHSQFLRRTLAFLQRAEHEKQEFLQRLEDEKKAFFQRVEDEKKEFQQRAEDEKKDLQVRQCDLQQQAIGLRPRIEQAEVGLKTIRLGQNACRNVFLTNISQIKDRYHEDLQTFKKSEESKRAQLEKDLKVTNDKLEVEKGKRAQLETDLKLANDKVELGKGKLLCQICMESARDTIILPCTHLLYCNGCLLMHKKRSNTCPACRGLMTALLHCHLSLE